jgi:hypothetical protein
VEVEYQFASCAFMAKRSQKDGGLEISYAQKNKCEKDWQRYWFYVMTLGVTPKVEPKIKFFPLTSSMVEMKPSTRVTPPAEVDAQ